MTIGPQKSPASVARIQAQVKSAANELAEEQKQKGKDPMNIAELVNHIHLRTRRGMPAVTDVVPQETTVLFTLGFRRYLCDLDLRVLEVREGKVFASPHADYQQGVLRGGKRDEHGNLLIEK